MPRRSPENAFLVEHYRPGLSVAGLGHCITQLHDAVVGSQSHRSPVRFLCSVIIPADEAFLVLLEADSVRDVTDVYARADSTFDRISAAIAAPPLPLPAHGGWQTPTS